MSEGKPKSIQEVINLVTELKKQGTSLDPDFPPFKEFLDALDIPKEQVASIISNSKRIEDAIDELLLSDMEALRSKGIPIDLKAADVIPPSEKYQPTVNSEKDDVEQINDISQWINDVITPELMKVLSNLNSTNLRINVSNVLDRADHKCYFCAARSATVRRAFPVVKPMKEIALNLVVKVCSECDTILTQLRAKNPGLVEGE